MFPFYAISGCQQQEILIREAINNPLAFRVIMEASRWPPVEKLAR
jgi:hypothetical protein